MIDPKYCEQVVAAVVHAAKFRWYVSPLEFWYLDYEKYAFSADMVPEDSYEVTERFGIVTLDQTSASTFIAKAVPYEATCHDLRSGLRNQIRKMNENYRPLEYMPLFYVDFDNQEFHSDFPEPIDFEFYIPNDWISNYGDVETMVPETERYWMDDGVNYIDRIVNAWKRS